MSLTKDEVVKMAREAGAVFDPRWGVASNVGTATFERFYTLCRAPLVAEVGRLKADLEQTREVNKDTLALTKDEVVKMAREAGFIIGRSVTTGEPNSPERFATLCRAPLVAENAALKQEQTSAVPVVEQLVEALDGLFSGDVVVWSLGGSARPRAAIAAGQKYLKENGK